MAIPILEKSIHQTMSWIYAIEERCDWQDDDHKKTFAALRTVLHHLRDLLPIENAIHLSAQLPLLIRGLFFENWSTHSVPSKIRKKEDLFESIEDDLPQYQDIDTETVTRSILEVLGNKVSLGEVEKILAVLPADIKDLF